MVMECGMSSEIGPVYIPEEKSAETRKVIDAEVTKILREAHGRVTAMLVRTASALRGSLGPLAQYSIPSGVTV